MAQAATSSTRYGMPCHDATQTAAAAAMAGPAKATVPFLASDLLRTLLLLYFPIISLYLVHTFNSHAMTPSPGLSTLLP